MDVRGVAAFKILPRSLIFPHFCSDLSSASSSGVTRRGGRLLINDNFHLPERNTLLQVNLSAKSLINIRKRSDPSKESWHVLLMGQNPSNHKLSSNTYRASKLSNMHDRGTLIFFSGEDGNLLITAYSTLVTPMLTLFRTIPPYKRKYHVKRFLLTNH